MVVRNPAGMKAAPGWKIQKGSYGSRGRAWRRMGIASILRSSLMKAREHMRKLESAGADPSKQPDTNSDMLSLTKVLNKEIPLRVHAHRADDIVTAIRIAEEFGIDYSIEHCTDGATVAEFLGKKQARVNVGPSMWSRAKIETLNISAKTPGILARAGCGSIIRLHPFHPIQFLVNSGSSGSGKWHGQGRSVMGTTPTPAETLELRTGLEAWNQEKTQTSRSGQGIHSKSGPKLNLFSLKARTSRYRISRQPISKRGSASGGL